ncbi:5-hydroxytryptamine receptor 1E-like isoform X1 [Leucoraja erinacea]|uniref:5-hydroxytryptamine receptor 1E-like isoform X1 n=2 Tax=Leucoraja erinaceus TaxID=7782 RepID=UPI0024578757|nr:5-hydroxytryptamine receptor 1E-like isoform X1 [Leucoraja erinacea]
MCLFLFREKSALNKAVCRRVQTHPFLQRCCVTVLLQHRVCVCVCSISRCIVGLLGVSENDAFVGEGGRSSSHSAVDGDGVIRWGLSHSHSERARQHTLPFTSRVEQGGVGKTLPAASEMLPDLPSYSSSLCLHFTASMQHLLKRCSCHHLHQCKTMNITDCPRGSGPERTKSFAEKTAVALTLSLVMILTVMLNGVVIAAISLTKKLHQPANYLICSLALTDLLVALTVMPLSILYISAETWLLGQAFCQAWLSLDMTFCTCSILHLSAIALDRYWAITDAVQYSRRRTGRRVAGMILAAWVLSVSISMPPLFWRSRMVNGTMGQQCTIRHDHAIYTIYSTFGAFYAPLGLILILYYRIYRAARTLHRRRASSCKLAHTSCPSEAPRPGSQLGREKGIGEQPVSMGRERRAARVLGLILGAFVLCWLPFFVKELLAGMQVWAASPTLGDLLTWLGYLNSLVNPLLYTSFNQDFVTAFRRVASCGRYG